MDTNRNICYQDGSLGRFFVCPACKTPITPPVRQCVKGHLICRRCFFVRRRCLVCRRSLDAERNVTIDILASIVRFPCAHAAYGCGEPPMAYKQRLSHEFYCPRRPFKCFVSGCKWIDEARMGGPSTVTTLSDHLQRCHGERLKFLHGSNLAIKLNPAKQMEAFKEDEATAETLTRHYVLADGEELYLAKVSLKKYSSEGLLLATVTGLWRPIKGAVGHCFSVLVKGSNCEMMHKAPVFSYMLSWEKSDHVLKALESSEGHINAGKYAGEGGYVLLEFSVMTKQVPENDNSRESTHESNPKSQSL
ncbi:uncharacterized protein LOC124174032 [Ischnura elegans]|uniref:uncharacterized protein LOC124174032 n=1 Tax=Ischnura elegans TaxID=197161 RepID=UPI001ED8A34E|nr:uncharacterized protein LOC124174032 [Ischnura elegans]